jgi:hypothetical protein
MRLGFDGLISAVGRAHLAPGTERDQRLGYLYFRTPRLLLAPPWTSHRKDLTVDVAAMVAALKPAHESRSLQTETPQAPIERGAPKLRDQLWNVLLVIDEAYGELPRSQASKLGSG